MTEEKKGVNWRAWTVGILVALAIIVALQNSQKISLVVRRHRREERRGHEG